VPARVARLVRERLPPRGAASAEFPHARSWADGRAPCRRSASDLSAPYSIMRNTLRGGPRERRRSEVVMVATGDCRFVELDVGDRRCHGA
jgi:hypothetical protein